MENYMGFDDYLYYVIAFDEEDRTISEYEYGNMRHARERFDYEKEALLIRYSPVIDGYILVDEKLTSTNI